jgi:hypothetical protein
MKNYDFSAFQDKGHSLSESKTRKRHSRSAKCCIIFTTEVVSDYLLRRMTKDEKTDRIAAEPGYGFCHGIRSR